MGPGQPDPAWGSSLHFGSWLPPFEEVILVQETEERARGGLGEKAWKECAREGSSPTSRQPGTF